MAHANIWDVFSASARLAGQVYGDFSKERELALDDTLLAQADELAKARTRISEEAPRFRNDPKGLADMAASEYDRWYAGADAAGNGSRYYRRRLDRMAAEARLTVDRQVAEARAVLDREHDEAAYEAADRIHANNPDPMEGYRARTAHNREAAEAGTLGPVRLQEQNTRAAEHAYERMVTPPDGYAGTTAEWEARVREAGAMEEFAGVRNREALERRGIEVGRGVVWRRNFDGAALADANYTEMMQRAAQGDTGAYAEALRIRDRWRPVQAGLDGNTEYDPGRKDQVRAMFRPWAFEAGEGDARIGAGVSQGAFMDDLKKRVFQGIDGAAPGVDVLGNALPAGIALSEAYSELDRYASQRGLNPLQLRDQFNTELVQATAATLSNTFRLDEGAIILRDIVTISQGELAGLKEAGFDGFDVQTELVSTVLNIWAGYQRAGDHGPQAEAALTQRLRIAKDDYVGTLLDRRGILRDDPATSASRYRNSGNVEDAARGYHAVLGNTAVATRSRDGSGYHTPASMDDTAASYISVAQGLMETDLGFDRSRIRLEDGKEVRAAARDGTEYRIVGTAEGKWYLERQDTIRDAGQSGTVWRRVAVRQSGNEGLRRWNAIENGRVRTDMRYDIHGGRAVQNSPRSGIGNQFQNRNIGWGGVQSTRW